ncbi:MAG: hypothetical protein HA490_03715 [Archaeoglobales archaeon]|nr:hypothetical protein [Archaeoglobales archaeon]
MKWIQMPKCGLVYNKYSPCLDERHRIGELGFEPADDGKLKPQLNAGSSAL